MPKHPAQVHKALREDSNSSQSALKARDVRPVGGLALAETDRVWPPTDRHNRLRSAVSGESCEREIASPRSSIHKPDARAARAPLSCRSISSALVRRAGPSPLARPAQQDGGRKPLGFGDDIQHPVDAVDEVDVPPTGRTEHDRRAWSVSLGGVAGQIVRSNVGFGFVNLGNNRFARLPAHQIFAQQLAATISAGRAKNA